MILKIHHINNASLSFITVGVVSGKQKTIYMNLLPSSGEIEKLLITESTFTHSLAHQFYE